VIFLVNMTLSSRGVRLRGLLTSVLDFCYPGICANCDATVGSGATLCAECEAHLDALAAAAQCDRCGMPVERDGAPCASCVGGGVPHYERVIRLGVFEDPLKNLIHQMKYHRRWTLGEFLASRLAATERAKGILHGADVLVPVPLHFRRHVERGYNQVDVIARRLGGEKRKIPVVHVLRRTRNTETQTHIHSHEKRLANVRDAFALRRAARHIADKHVIVVDDVMTTGATLNAVARVLNQAEPASLCVMCLAIADPKRRGFEVV
jgi:ComF family protein